MVWKQADEPAPKKRETGETVERFMCTTFWDHHGVIYTEYLRIDRKEGHTVTNERYIEILYNLRKAIKCKCRGLLLSRVIILHDNATAHTARITLAFLANFWLYYFHPSAVQARSDPIRLLPVPFSENMIKNATVYQRC